MTNGSVPPVPPQAPQTKKGLSPWLWVGIGCLGLLVLGGIVATVAGVYLFGKAREVAREMEDDPIATTAKFIAAANPDIELVEANKDDRTVTFRDTKTGEEFTFGYDDIESGKVTFSSGGKTAEVELKTEGEDSGELTVRSDEGTATFRAGGDAGDVPEWVPVYPGVSTEGTFASETSETRSGAFHFETGDDLDEVLDYYEKELTRSGLEVKSRTTSGEGALLVASSSDQRWTLNVIASKKDGGTGVVVNFNEKR